MQPLRLDVRVSVFRVSSNIPDVVSDSTSECVAAQDQRASDLAHQVCRSGGLFV
jgi:hypothetical protein